MPLEKKLVLAALCVMAVVSCTKEPVSTTDPLPVPAGMDESKDTSVRPGDSFYNYCNGSWLKKTPIPATGAVGSMYNQEIVMENLLKELKATNPQMKHYYALRDAESGNPEASKAYLDALKAKFHKPTTVEEYFWSFGRMMAEGIFPSWDFPIMPAFDLVWVDGKFKGMISHPMDVPEDGTPTSTDPDTEAPFGKSVRFREFSSFIDVTTTNDGEISAESLIIQGMGLNPKDFVSSPDMAPMWDEANKMTVDQLQRIWEYTWARYEPYGAEKLTDIQRQAADCAIGYIRSYHFAQKYLSPQLKDKLVGITKEIQDALGNRIRNVEWMSDATKANAIDKLESIGLNIVYPDEWHLDCIPDVTECKTLVEFVVTANKGIFNLRRQLIGTSDVFSQQIATAAYDLTFVNAFYSPNHNVILIYPGLFLPPLLPENVSDAYAYAVFAMIGHELTHAFDDYGAQYDKFGNKNNWWTIADKMSFEERSAIYVDCHNHLEVDPVRKPGVYNDGKRTLGENIADLGGFLATLDAYQARLDKDGYTGETRKEQLRKFFESFAYVEMSQYSDAKLERFIKKDVHSISKLRIDGVVMNVDLWYDLYDVDRNCNLYLPKERRTYIW